jgi:DNA primase
LKDKNFKDRISKVKETSAKSIVINKYNLDMRKSGENLIGLCPFHDDNSPSFQVFENGFKCYAGSCGLKGDVIKLVGFMKFGPTLYSGRGPEFIQVLEEIEEFQSGSFTAHPLAPSVKKSKSNERPPITKEIQHIWDVALSIAHETLLSEPKIVDYLLGRGYTETTLRKWRFGFWPRKTSSKPSRIILAMKAVGFSDKELLKARLLWEGKWGVYEPLGGGVDLSGRIVFAETSPARLPVFLTSRILPWEDDNSSPKYLYIPGFEKPLFGLSSISRTQKTVFLTDGIIDMHTLFSWGYDAVSPGGTSFSHGQLKAIRRLSRKIVPVRDLDDPGRSGIIAGLKGLEDWQEAIPGLPTGINLPTEVDGKKIKDVNDLTKTKSGEIIFRDLAKKWL